MYRFLVSGLVCLLLFSCETKRVNFNEGYVKNNVFYFDNEPLNGIMFRTYQETGRLMIESNLKNGLPHGILTSYYKNGKVKSKQMFKNGKKDGSYEFYQLRTGISSSEHFLYEKENYIDDELSGEYFLYELDGSVELEGYYKNGEKNGLWQSFNSTPSGLKPDEVGNYVNGKKQGVWASYSYHDDLTKISLYEDGREIDWVTQSGNTVSLDNIKVFPEYEFGI